MMNMLNRLKSLEQVIKVAIIGIGSAGKGLFYQCGMTPGMECVAIADIKIEKAIECVESMGHDYRVINSVKEMHEAIHQGLVAVCEDGDILAQCELMDVLIEASNAIGDGAKFAITALECHKHLVMMNAEADLIFGPYLMELAEKKGVVYTSCDGDQPGVIRRLIDDLQLWGFELVMAGNIKGFLDRYSNPTKIIPEADKRNLDYKMCASYTDGSKLCVEMALVANAYGLSTAVPGMYGPRADNIHDVFDLFDFDALWKDKNPVVDYVLGAKPYGGVFAIGYCDNKYQQSMLDWFPPEMGRQPFYLFYRPYHLIHIEAMACVAEAFLDRQSLLKPRYGFCTNVYAYAKKDLREGDELDGIGGYAIYGLIENCAMNEENPGLSVCLAENVTLKKNVKKDDKIFMADVHYDKDDFEFYLFSKAMEASKGSLS